MPFEPMKVVEVIEEKRQKSADFKKEWDESREEYRLVGEMIQLRKQANITQNELANLTGNKQQVISRIENRDNCPSLRIFCNLLYALGYELQIVKRKIN